MPIIYSGLCDIGMKRKTNQDSILMMESPYYFAVADGMGGHLGGDIASQESVKFLKEKISELKPPLDGALIESLLQDITKKLNHKIYTLGKSKEELHGMGTTLTSLFFNGPETVLANVGDSRIYLFNKDGLFQLTKDHSLVQEKLNLKIYDRQTAQKDPQKNVLVRTIGFEANVQADIYHYKLNPNDLFLLCSDGLYGKVSDEDIEHLMTKHIHKDNFDSCSQESLNTLSKELVELANKNGGQDNISVILVMAI